MIIFYDMIDSPLEQEKFEIIYHTYHTSLYNLAYSITKNQCDAEDVIQTSMIKLIKVLYKIPQEEVMSPACRALLISIVKNTALDLLRRRRHMPVPVESFFMESKSASTEEVYIRAEELRSVIRSIGELQENYKDVLRLRIFYQFTAKETAEIMCTNEANVNTLLGRARKQLYKKYEEYKYGKRGGK